MLPPRLTRTRRAGKKLELLPVRPQERAQLLEWATSFLTETRACQGKTRMFWEQTLHPWLQVPASQKKMCLGLQKVLEDHIVFESPFGAEAVSLREAAFTKASQARWDHVGDWPNIRNHILQEAAAEFRLAPLELEEALWADRMECNLLQSIAFSSSEELVAAYEQAQVPAILLCATQLVVDVSCVSAEAYRALFRRIRFLQLLPSIIPTSSGYRITIEGPFSLFQSTTKYGLQLALLVPFLKQCPSVVLRAKLRWGIQKLPLEFTWEHHSSLPPNSPTHTAVSEELDTLLQQWGKLSTSWIVSPCQELLSTPDGNVLVPDLQFSHVETGEVIYLESLGFWSREAVWRRIEWVQQGLPYRLLFAVNKRLRVSEEALEEKANSHLYVHNGTLSPRLIHSHLEQMTQQKGTT